MKIAYIFSGTPSAAWSVSDGIAHELGRMGHEVSEFARGRWNQQPLSLEKLKAAELILVSGLEHLAANPQLSIFSHLKKEEWMKLAAPKVAVYHESFTRPDYNIRFDLLRPLADEHFFPAAQDADTFDQEHFAKGHAHWLPFGVDTEVFHPEKCLQCGGKRIMGVTAPCDECGGTGFVPSAKTVDVGFIGMMYGERQTYADKLAPHLKDVRVVTGNVIVQDIDGYPYEEMARRLAANYRRIKVFFNFPALSRLLVTKVFEVMACGTLLVTPYLEDAAEKNCELFEHGKQLIYYQKNHLGFINQILREYVARDTDREFIAWSGFREVREKHSLRIRLEKVLEVIGGRERQETGAAVAAGSGTSEGGDQAPAAAVRPAGV